VRETGHETERHDVRNIRCQQYQRCKVAREKIRLHLEEIPPFACESGRLVPKKEKSKPADFDQPLAMQNLRTEQYRHKYLLIKQTASILHSGRPTSCSPSKVSHPPTTSRILTSNPFDSELSLQALSYNRRDAEHSEIDFSYLDGNVLPTFTGRLSRTVERTA
jgi:hypothetical protein